jgi:ABC-type multidrug transport system ATPase subunit
MSMLELTGLRKRYHERQVLDGATLVVRAGEACALLGANGSGKTTLLRCVVGLHHLDGGRLNVDGCDAVAKPREARARLSYLPQRAEFPSTLTVREILRVVAALRKVPAGRVERELALCGLEKLASRTVARLSGGERQRVALATLLLPDVGLYLLDEPTASLDADGAALLVERVSALRAAGRAVLFTTHIGSDLDRLATRVTVLRHGRVEPSGEPGEEDRHATIQHRAAAVGNGAAGWMYGAREWTGTVAGRSR